jgi:hypothetical protein
VSPVKTIHLLASSSRRKFAKRPAPKLNSCHRSALWHSASRPPEGFPPPRDDWKGLVVEEHGSWRTCFTGVRGQLLGRFPTEIVSVSPLRTVKFGEQCSAEVDTRFLPSAITSEGRREDLQADALVDGPPKSWRVGLDQ